MIHLALLNLRGQDRGAHPAHSVPRCPALLMPDGPGRGIPMRGEDLTGVQERLTVNLVARSAQALAAVTGITGESKTDAFNRAIQVYALLQQVQNGGGAIYIRDQDGAELERVRII